MARSSGWRPSFRFDLREKWNRLARAQECCDAQVRAAERVGRIAKGNLVPGLDVLEVERAVERLGCAGQEWLDQDGRYPQPLGEIRQDQPAGGEVGPGQLEGLGLLDVPIRCIDDLEPDPLHSRTVVERDHQFAQNAHQGRKIQASPPGCKMDYLDSFQTALEVSRG